MFNVTLRTPENSECKEVYDEMHFCSNVLDEVIPLANKLNNIMVLDEGIWIPCSVYFMKDYDSREAALYLHGLNLPKMLRLLPTPSVMTVLESCNPRDKKQTHWGPIFSLVIHVKVDFM